MMSGFKAFRVMGHIRPDVSRDLCEQRDTRVIKYNKWIWRAFVGTAVGFYGFIALSNYFTTDEQRLEALCRAYPMPADLRAEMEYRERARIDPSYTNPTLCLVCNRAMDEHSIRCDLTRPPGYIHAKM